MVTASETGTSSASVGAGSLPQVKIELTTTGGRMPVLDHVSFDAPFAEEHDDEGAPPGRELADAIHAGLVERAVQCDPIDESDYAYSFRAESGATHAMVMVGHVGDVEGRQWLVFVHAGKAGGLLRRKPADITALVESLHRVVVEDLGAVPQWFTEQEWNDPSFGRGQPEPIT